MDTLSPNHAAARTGANRSNENGSALLMVILAMFIIVSLGMGASRVATTEVEVAANYQQSWSAFYAADGAAQASFGELITLSRQIGRFPEQSELDTITVQELQGTTLSNRSSKRTDPPG